MHRKLISALAFALCLGLVAFGGPAEAADTGEAPAVLTTPWADIFLPEVLFTPVTPAPAVSELEPLSLSPCEEHCDFLLDMCEWYNCVLGGNPNACLQCYDDWAACSAACDP